MLTMQELYGSQCFHRWFFISHPASSESGESVGVEVDGCRLKKQSSPSARGGSRLSGACRHGRVGACVLGRLGRAFPRCSSFSDVGDKFGRLSAVQ